MPQNTTMIARWLYCDNNKPSTAKLNRQITFVVATFIVVYQTWANSLATELFAMYITVFTGVELAARWQKGKFGEFENDNAGTDVRRENEPPRRNSKKEG